MGQKTDTIDRQKTKSSTDYDTTSRNEPPSWKELSQKSDLDKTTKDALALSATAIALGFLLPISSWTVAIFITAIAGSTVGVGDATSGALSGAIVLGITSFLGSFLLTLLSLGSLTVIPAIIIGLLVGGIGGFLGSKIRGE